MTAIGLNLEQLEDAASKLRAIAHPMRVAIIELLNANEKLNVTDIYTKLQIEQASASHHLNILKSKGVLSSSRDGKKTYYFLKHSAISNIIDCLNRCGD